MSMMMATPITVYLYFVMFIDRRRRFKHFKNNKSQVSPSQSEVIKYLTTDKEHTGFLFVCCLFVDILFILDLLIPRGQLNTLDVDFG